MRAPPEVAAGRAAPPVRRSQLFAIDDHAVVDVDDPPGMPGHGGVVGDQDDRDAVRLVELLEHAQDLLARAGVEVARGLIGEQQRRTVHQGPGDRHALLLAAGKLGRLVVQPVLEPDPAEHLLGPLPGLALGEVSAVYDKRHGHVLQGAGARQQVEVLEDETQLVVPHQGRWSAESRDISCPSSQYSPEVGRSRQPRMFISVLLPEPDAPIRATISPPATVSDTPLSTGTAMSPMW